MISRFYEEHLQTVDGKPELSVETIPEIWLTNPSTETSPKLQCPSPHRSPDLKINVVPHLPAEELGERMEQHVRDIVEIGEYHDEKPGTKRVRFDDHGLSPAKKSRMVALVEQIAADDDGGNEPGDKDIMELQMIAIEALEEERDSLEVENIRLRALNREQTASRVRVLKEIVRHRGVELKAHGDFLIKMAHSGLSECREG